MTKLFFTSDTHYGHTNILKYCKRPFKDISDMDNSLIKNYNSLVTKEDLIFHLGDFSLFNSPLNYISLLNGHISFIKGNHDKHPLFSIHDATILDKYGKSFYLVHDPLEAESVLSYFDMVLCGHLHNKFKVVKDKNTGCFIVNVGVDVWDYKPITIPNILKYIEKQNESIPTGNKRDRARDWKRPLHGFQRNNSTQT